MQKIANGSDYKIPATIDDAAALTGIAEVLRRGGYAKKQSTSEVSRILDESVAT